MMKPSSWQDLLAIFGTTHDGYYPSKSPTCEPRLCACGDPLPSCLMREYVFHSGGKPFCRAPATYTPDEYHTEPQRGGASTVPDCPHRRYDVESPHKAGTIRHASNHKTGKSIPPARAMSIKKHGKRQDRMQERTRVWVSCWLLSAMRDHRTARILYYDLDEPIDHSALAKMGEQMWRDWVSR